MGSIFDPQKFCEFSERRNEIALKNQSNIVATAFKSKRLQLNMTLSEATKDICSKAYLCKFENNQIMMDDKVVRVLCERVDLDYEKVKNLNHDNSLVNGVRMFLFNQFDQIDGLIKTIDFDCFIASNKLLELLNSLVNANFSLCEELIVDIDRVRSSLSEYEFVTFGICICEYYIRTNQFLKGLQFIKKFKYDISFKDLRCIHLEQRFNIFFNLEMKCESFNAYKILEKEFDNGYPRKREFLDKLHYLELFSSIDTICDLKDMLDDLIPEEYIEEYWYTYCLCLIKNGQFSDALQLITKYELNNSRFVALYVYAAYNLACIQPEKNGEPLAKRLSSKVITYMNNLVDKMEKNHLNVIDCNFIKLMQLELVGEAKEDLVDYIRDTAIKYDKNYQHRLYSYVYSHHLFDLLGKMTRYKEAYLIAKNDRTFN